MGGGGGSRGIGEVKLAGRHAGAGGNHSSTAVGSGVGSSGCKPWVHTRRSVAKMRAKAQP